MPRSKSATWPRTNWRSLKGKRFGRLKVMAETDKRLANGTIVWWCRCRCGGEAFVGTSNLTSGNTESCGCWQKEISRVANGKRKEFS